MGWIDRVGEGREGEVSLQGQGGSDTQPVGRTGDLAVWRRPERGHWNTDNPTPGWPSLLARPRDTNAMFCQVKPELSSTKQCLDGPSYLHWTRNLSSLFPRHWVDTTNSQMFENNSSLRKTFCKACEAKQIDKYEYSGWGIPPRLSLFLCTLNPLKSMQRNSPVARLPLLCPWGRRGGGRGEAGGGREATQADMKSAEAAGRYQWGCQSTHDKSAPVEPESRECRNMCKHLNCNYCKSGIPTSWLTVISEHCWKLIRKLPFIYKYVGKSGRGVLNSEATKFCVGLKTSRNETKVLKFITIYFLISSDNSSADKKQFWLKDCQQ